MRLDPTTIDPLTKEWWEMRRVEVVEERRDAKARDGGGNIGGASASSDGAGVGGGNNGDVA
jgi:hypothetical protein